jgi:serine/threonine protein kinase
VTDTADPRPEGAGSSPDFAGTIIAGRYRILRKLGEGAMGGVYLGEHLKIGRKDAIKVLRGGLASDRESIARFRRGARNLSAIHHPNVCTLYDYGETEDGSPFLALEFVTGETLLDVINREKRLEPARAFHIARQTADALGAAHEAGIVHRDLKPSNIMIERGRDGRDFVKVVDFDIAKGPEGQAGDELTSVGMVVGTPEYMSPEQLMGEALDGRSDLYSLGIVLFRMLTGGYPFRSRGSHAIMSERMTTPPLTLENAFPQGVFPAGVQSVLDRAMTRNRDERYARAGDLAADLAALERAGRAKAQESAEAPTMPWLAQPATEAATMPWLPQPPPTRATPTATGSTAVQDPSARSRTRTSHIWIALPFAAAAGLLGVWVALHAVGPAPSSTDGTGAGTPTEGESGQQKEGGAGVVTGDTGTHGGPVDPTGGGIAIDPARAEDVLIGLLDRLPGPGSSTYSAAGLQAIHDTAEAFYASTSVGSRDRAFAAYIIASYHEVRGDTPKCREWTGNALSLDPAGPGYRKLFERCGGSAP